MARDMAECTKGSEMTHTPEPWKVFMSTDGTKLLGVGSAETAEGIVDYKGGIWASEDEGIANSRRIVACVNACAGMKVETLERLILGELAGEHDADMMMREAQARADDAEALLNDAHFLILELRGFILSEYELQTSEAHHDGHLIAKDARAAWDNLHAFLAKLDARKAGTP
ncbi:MAG: hypothetical protein ABUJ98_15465 [Hyphomicrobium sp.]